MKLLMMGPPGAGKGTQAQKVVDDYQLVSISTGEMFRESYRKKESLGLLAMEFIRDGHLVSDEITNEFIRRRLLEKNQAKSFLLDGFPRTLNQAEALDDMLDVMDSKLDAVIQIVIDDDIILDRMVGRRSCSICGSTYHLEHKPSKEKGVCDACGGVLYQREDDKHESVLNRLAIYKVKTKPLIDYYEQKGILHEVDGAQSFNDVYHDVKAILEAIQ